jgi:hypothetical protein
MMAAAALVVVVSKLRGEIGPLLRRNRHLVMLALVLVPIAAAPLGYIVYNLKHLASSERPDGLSASDWKSYLRLVAEGGVTCAPKTYFRQYITGDLDPASKTDGERDDRSAYFVGRATLGLAALGLVLTLRKSWAVALYGVLGVLLCLGVNSPINLPRLLFTLRVPGMDCFRQWYHFFPITHAALCLMAAIGVACLVERCRRGGTTAWIAAAVLHGAVPLLVLDVTFYAIRASMSFTHPAEAISLEQRLCTVDHRPSLFLYKTRYNLDEVQSEFSAYITNRDLWPAGNYAPGWAQLADYHLALVRHLIVAGQPGIIIDASEE